MATELSWNRYGKSRIRLVKIRRRRDGDAIVDLTLDVQLEGAFDAVYIDGDNRSCLATDTMKNTVYALARRDPIDHVEAFALRLAEYFIAKPSVSRVKISVVEHPWSRVLVFVASREGAESLVGLIGRVAMRDQLVDAIGAKGERQLTCLTQHRCG